MHGLNSVNLGHGSAAVFILPLDNGSANGPEGSSKSSKALQEVVNKLVQALTKNGELDESSPLGKMLAKAMAANGKSGGGIEDIMAALDKLIHQKLGDNFGASADAGRGAGSGVSGASGGGGESVGDSGDAGQSDLMTQVLNGLAKAMLDDLLTPQGDGASLSKDNMPMLDKIAQFMDDNKSQFPAPESGSWKNELTQSTHLNEADTSILRSALDILSQQLGKQQSDASVADGGLGSPVSDTSNSPVSLDDSSVESNPISDNSSKGNDGLGQLLGELVERGLQSVLSGGGLGTPVSDTLQPGKKPGDDSSSPDLAQLLGGLIEKGLKASLQEGADKNGGSDLQNSAAQTVALIVDALLQGTKNQAVS